MLKLRKILEESQVESEDAMNALRKKHQDSLLDYQEQIEQLHKKNGKYVCPFTIIISKVV